MADLKNDIICTGCSLLCNDIAIEIEQGKVKTTHHVCARGYGQFYQLDFKYRLLKPLLNVNGQQKEVSYEEAIKEAIILLKKAKNPFFYGWASTTLEAQQKGIQLAQKYNAAIDCTATCTIGAAVQQFLQKNIEIPNLEDIRDNADVIIFWGSNPTASHIRLLSKFCLMARGTNTARGIEDRTAITIDIRKTDMSKFSEEYLRIAPGGDTDLLKSFLQILEGKSFTKDEVAGVSRKTIYNVVNLIKDARFGVIFFGNGYMKSAENMNTLIKFLEILKQRGVKFGAIPLDGGYNAIGFNTSLQKQVDLTLNADFRQPQCVGNQSLLTTTLESGEVDLLFVVGSDPISNLPSYLSKLIAQIPIITIDYQQTPTTMYSKVVIPTTIPGVESAGTAYRLDFQPVQLKKILEPPEGIHSDESILNDLLKLA
ncbi:MAG: formylmethanofuran dehydrogenase subunit B [Candidatus Helarchaeota archaeon]